MKKGWEIKKLGDVCNKGSSNVSQNQLEKDNGIYPIFGASGLIKNVSFYHQDKPYLSIVKDGSGVGRVTKMEAFTSVIGTLQYILPNEGIDLDYLNYTLMSVDFKKYVAGAAIPHIYFKDYKNESFLWMPLPEQIEIVSLLNKAFAGIAKAKENVQRNLQNAKELFQSEMNSIFENKGEGWVVKQFQDTVDKDCTLSYGIVQPGEEFPNGIPVVRPTDLTKKMIGLSGLKLVNPSVADGYKRTTLKGIELLLCVRGTTGVISIASKELKGANVTRGIVPIVFDNNILSQEFGYYLLVSPFLQNQIKEKTYGAALMQINIGDLRKISIPFPSLKEQKKIVSQLDTLSTETKNLENIYQQKLNALEELKKSILQKAFSGELKTFATDVPA
jgi:type I restriction enzyme S subunit